MSKSKNFSSGVGTPVVVFIVFLILKLAKVGTIATWSWWWVFSPLWISFAVGILLLVIVLIIKVICDR